MPGLSEKEIATHAERLLPIVSRAVAKALGPDAADHAGSCLFDALTKYDSDRGENLDAFAKGKTINLVKDAIREMDGRKGTARYEAKRKMVRESALDLDAKYTQHVESISRLEKQEQLSAAVKTLGRLRAVPRWLLLAKMFGDFSNVELTRMLNVSERQLCRDAAELRQLLSVG